MKKEKSQKAGEKKSVAKSEVKNSVFNLVNPFAPAGDQPRAIAELIKGFTVDHKNKQTLLGVTGSKKIQQLMMKLINFAIRPLKI